MKTIKKFLYLLTPKELKRAILLLIMITIMALLDMIGIASIFPFMSVVSNPDIIYTNKFLNEIFQFSNKFGIESEDQFIFILGIFTFFLLLVSISFKALTTYAQLSFVQMRQYSISKRVLDDFLHQPYSWFLNRNSAELGKSILSEVGTIVGKGLAPIFELISRSMVSVAIIFLLILVDPKIALITGLVIGGFYSLIFFLINNYIYRIGKERFKSNKLRFMTISEAFGATKEIKVGGLENTFINRFSNASKIFARKQVYIGILSQLPRYFLEIIAFGGAILMILFLMFDKGSINNSLPVISIYVFAGYRLMPSIQQIYSCINQITYVSSSLNSLYEDLKNLKKNETTKNRKRLPIQKSIDLKNIYYNYPNSSGTTLKNISINIPVNTTIGLMGTTGSGKTTIIDIILGLLEVHKGTLEVDGQIITKNNVRAWQSSIGYVPQHIYLSDDSIAANIAFGENSQDINYDAVEKASKIANLHDFIINELPEQI
jgi:ABC-type multidrug transport system fused ATPase/permease subunit